MSIRSSTQVRSEIGRGQPGAAAESAPWDSPPVERTAHCRPALQVQEIGCSYDGDPVLQGVSFEVSPGEILCLVGPSGCGKTTTLRLIAGLEPTRSGRIIIGDRTASGEGRHVPTEQRSVGLLFQDHALFPHMRVIDNIGFGVRGVSRQERRSRSLAVLAQVGLEAYAHKYPHVLSGGQQQRVALARALAAQPKVLLLDEPFSSLDSELRRQVRDDTMHLLKACDAAVVLVTHDPEEAMFMADRIALLKDGRIEQIGAPVDIYCRPVNAFVASFFGETNRLHGTVAEGTVATPVGPVSAGTLADGTPAEVVIRPEAIRLTPSHDPKGGALVRVEASRMLGRTSLVHLSVPGHADGVHLHARIPGPFLPREGQLLRADLDRHQTFVFARDPQD